MTPNSALERTGAARTEVDAPAAERERLPGGGGRMYFWRIEALKAQLRRGPLDQRLAFGYLVATFLVYAALTEAPGLWNAEVGEAGALCWVTYGAYLLVIAAGTSWAFAANGGRVGLDFAARYLAIRWVVEIRVLAVFFLAMSPLAVLLGVGLGTGVIGEPPDAAWEWAGAVIGLGVEALVYGRLAHHMREVAAAGVAVDGSTSLAG